MIFVGALAVMIVDLFALIRRHDGRDGAGL